MPSGLRIEDLTVGSGLVAQRSATLTIHYRGYHNHGDLFRSSYDEGQPLTFRIGSRHIIVGLEQGVIGMRVGGVCTIPVSPHLAYRDQVLPTIPANDVLRSEVELLDVRDQDHSFIDESDPFT